MHVGQTVQLFTFENSDEGRSFEATVMIVEHGTITLKERGRDPVRWSTKTVVESMLYRRLVDATLLQTA